MATATFQRLNQTLLYLPEGVDPQDARSGYILRPSASDPPPAITLSDSLQTYAGVYLLFPMLPVSDTDPTVLENFIAAVQTFLATSAPATHLVWISNPQTAASGILGMTQEASLQDGVLTTPQANFITVAPNIQLRISGGTQITASSDGTALVFTAASGAPNVLLVTPNGQQEPQTIGLADAATLPLLAAGLPSGCFTLDIAPDLDGLAYLGAGLRYFATSLNPDDPPNFVTALPYPLFQLGTGQTLPLFGVIDPLAALDSSRTFFSFSDQGTAPTIVINSYLRSALNALVTLTPHANAQLIFAVDVVAQTDDGQPDPTNPYYLTPAGDFDLAINTTGGASGAFASLLMCGASAVEYFDLGSSSTITFKPGFPAFSPASPPPSSTGAKPLPPVYGGLTRQAFTSWVYLNNQQHYYAQPSDAVLHQPDAQHPNFLNYLEVPSGQLSPPASTSALAEVSAPATPQAFPLVPYAGIQLVPNQNYMAIEAQVLGPARRNTIYQINPNYASSPNLARRGATATADRDSEPTMQQTYGTTPQGLLLGIEDAAWSELTLAQTSDLVASWPPPSPSPAQKPIELEISNVDGPLKAALQSNQLFMVVSSSAKFLQNADIANYRLTVQSWTDLEQSQSPVVPQEILTKLKNSQIENCLFTSYASYTAALQGILGGDYSTYATVLRQVGASFGVTIQSWHFDFSPYFWQGYSTLMIFKFINSPFRNLVENIGSWARAGDLNDDPVSTQQSLKGFIDDPQIQTNPNLTYFRETVLDDPTWNGVLVLRSRVPLSGLPAELEGIAAGIDPSRFFAHHIGFTVSPVTITTNSDGTQSASMQNSTLFGLVNYDDPADLTDQNTDYQFKVQNLSVLFVNSEVSNFSSQIELLVNRLFGEPALLQNSMIGNNIQLAGVYQRHGDSGSYIFRNANNNIFQMSSQVLDQVVINQAQFITVVPPGGLQVGQNVQTKFTFVGNIAFKALPLFDIFSFGGATGGLAYSNLSVDMSFPPDMPSHKTFGFDAQQITFNTALSLARPDSLYPHFPLKLSGFIQATDKQTPATLNYMPVDSVLTGSQLGAPWFGLVFDLNLGSLGALAGQVGFIASLLLAWQPNPTAYKIYIGLQIPGATAGKREISIEGVIKLVFGDVRFVVVEPGAYILQLRNIALKLLSLSFPPGQTDLLLFGDPQGKDNSTLGWYAAYLKANQGKGNGSKAPKQLALPPDDSQPS